MPVVAVEPYELRRMRWIATGLLVAMAFLFVAARWFEPLHPALGFVRAFAEAAMIGALADWFAVVALFRHPMGLPIPHTAIIPRNKERIGEGLGRFVEENFLAPELVTQKLASTDLAGWLARWVREPENRDLIVRRLTRFIPSALNALADEDIQRLVRDTLLARMEKVKLAPFAGELLGILVAKNRHHMVVDELLVQAARVVREYEPEIRGRVRDKTAWLWKKIGVDERVADKLLEAADETLQEVAQNPEHEWRVKLDAIVARFADDLKTNPRWIEEGEALKNYVLTHPAFARYLQGVWSDIRREIVADAGREDSAIRARIGEILDLVADYVLNDEPVRRKLNRVFRAAIGEIVESRRHEVAELIAATVKAWDTETLTQKIEHQVGRDLQYIRINGTLIGGLVGVAIHTVSRYLPG